MDQLLRPILEHFFRYGGGLIAIKSYLAHSTTGPLEKKRETALALDISWRKLRLIGFWQQQYYYTWIVDLSQDPKHTKIILRTKKNISGEKNRKKKKLIANGLAGGGSYISCVCQNFSVYLEKRRGHYFWLIDCCVLNHFVGEIICFNQPVRWVVDTSTSTYSYSRY